MTLLDRYIFRHVILAILAVLFVLGGLDLLFTLLDEAGGTNERYSFMDALYYVLLTFPRHLYELLPMSSLIGALVGLGILAGSNELVVMQASGVKVARIVWAVMKPTALVMLLALVTGEFIAPPLDMRAELHKSLAEGQGVLLSRNGYWMRSGNQYLHANAIEPGGELIGVTVYEYGPDQQPRQTLTAERALYLGDEGGENRWRLEGITRIEFEMGNDQGLASRTSTLDRLDVQVDIDPDLLDVLVVEPDNMALSDLFRYASHFRRQGQDASQYFLSFWKKALQPLTTVVLVLVAISFIFGPLRSSTMGARLFTAICFGLAFQLLQRMFGIVSLVYQSDPLLAVLVPIVLSALFGGWMLRKAA